MPECLIFPLFSHSTLFGLLVLLHPACQTTHVPWLLLHSFFAFSSDEVPRQYGPLLTVSSWDTSLLPSPPQEAVSLAFFRPCLLGPAHMLELFWKYTLLVSHSLWEPCSMNWTTPPFVPERSWKHTVERYNGCVGKKAQAFLIVSTLVTCLLKGCLDNNNS